MRKVALLCLMVAAVGGCGDAGEANSERRAFRLEAGVLVEIAPEELKRWEGKNGEFTSDGRDNVHALYCSNRCDFGYCGCEGDAACCITACHECNIDCGENEC